VLQRPMGKQYLTHPLQVNPPARLRSLRRLRRLQHGRLLFPNGATPRPFTSLVAVEARLRSRASLRLFQHGRLLFPNGATPRPFTSPVAVEARLRSRATAGSLCVVVRGKETALFEARRRKPQWGGWGVRDPPAAGGIWSVPARLGARRGLEAAVSLLFIES
jgi:hypothetical protein